MKHLAGKKSCEKYLGALNCQRTAVLLKSVKPSTLIYVHYIFIWLYNEIMYDRVLYGVILSPNAI